MPQFILSDPQITVNDELWPVKGNTVTYTDGRGEHSVEGLSTGGGSTIISVSTDVTTKVPMLNFSMPADPASIDKVDAARGRFTNNTIVVAGSDNLGNQITKTFSSAIIVNNPERELQQDGSIALEWKAERLS